MKENIFSHKSSGSCIHGNRFFFLQIQKVIYVEQGSHLFGISPKTATPFSSPEQ